MTARHTYTLVRLPIEPCTEYPEGVPGGALTARQNEGEARYWERIVAASFPWMNYTTREETLQ